MGNRAVITTPERKIGLYLHWNGGRDTVEPLLKYCELKGYRPPTADIYGWARLAQVMGNFFGGTLSVGIGPYTTDERMDPGDNGIYVIDGWEIVARIPPFEGFEEQREHRFDEMLRTLDRAMPEGERLGEFLDSVEVPVAGLELGDEVWIRTCDDLAAYPVVGFGGKSAGHGEAGRPYVALYDHDGDYGWNPNNYVRGETCRIRPRK